MMSLLRHIDMQHLAPIRVRSHVAHSTRHEQCSRRPLDLTPPDELHSETGRTRVMSRESDSTRHAKVSQSDWIRLLL